VPISGVVNVQEAAAPALDVLDRTFVECSALGFQSVVTSVLAIACYVLWQRHRGDHFLTWAMAWSVYVVRLACMSFFLVRRDMVWLFLHQAATSISALLLLAAAMQMSRGFKLRPVHALAVPLSAAWAWITIYGMGSMLVAGVTATVLLSAVTIWTGVVFWRERDRVSSWAAPMLAGAFILWGLHHLDYPLLRAFGGAVLYGVFADVLFLFAIGLGLLFVVLGNERDRLAARTSELEQLTRLMLRVQEDERRRIAQELHDEAGQVLTAVKIELELEGKREAGAMVGRALAQVRDLSNLLRPSVLDDLGLVPALRALADDFATRTRIALTLDLEGADRRLPPDLEVVIYRVVQEALTNVARHAGATEAQVRIESDDREVQLYVDDNGRGAAEDASPNMGWLGMRERVTALGGRLAIGKSTAGGVRLDARMPIGELS
jgi:signal transduction histidine kinase